MIRSVGIDLHQGRHRARCLDDRAQPCDSFSFQTTPEGLDTFEEHIFRDGSNPVIVFEPAPPDWATFKKLAEYWTGAIGYELDHAPNDVKARFAELFDLHVTIYPDSSRDGYHLDLSANIPLEMEGDKPGAYDMVFSPPRGG